MALAPIYIRDQLAQLGREIATHRDPGLAWMRSPLTLDDLLALRETMAVKLHALLPPLWFGPHAIGPDQVIVRDDLAAAIVNIRPLVPGHTLVITTRPCARFADLTPAEVAALWTLAQRVGRGLEALHCADALTFSMQDGAGAGQSVPHVHVHVLPRRPGQFAHNDDVYDALEANGRALSGSFDRGAESWGDTASRLRREL